MDGQGSEADGEKGAWRDALAGLPHGAEFRFIDRITSLTPGLEGEGEGTPQGDEAFFRGHFPGKPIVPGVLMIEAIAQLAGVVVCAEPDGEWEGLLLTAVRSAKILGVAKPGDLLVIHASMLGKLGGMVQATGTVFCGGKPLVKGDVVLVRSNP